MLGVRHGFVRPSREASHRWASADTTNGAVSLGSTLLNTAWVLPVRITADTDALREAAAAELEAAVGQHTFTMTSQLGGGALQTWTCYAAAVSRDDAFLVDRAGSPAELAVCTIPCLPTPGVS